jgi:tetratricopeptide (TPR) repeat protein
MIARQAADDYRRALELNSRDAVAHHNLAWLEHLSGDDKVAAEHWRDAVAIDPANAVFHLSYGMFLEETGDNQKAHGEYEIAIELSPSILDSQFFKRYRVRSRDGADSVVAESIKGLERRLQKGPDPILEARLGKFSLFLGDLSRATALLEDASQNLPNLPLVWLNLGDAYEKQGQWTKAMDCYRKAKIIDGSQASTYLRTGEIELRSGQQKAAVQSFTQAIERWQRVTPITAAHNNRMYVGPRQRIDDLLPTTLVWYTTPCEASRGWQVLAQLFPAKQEYARRIHTCEQLPSPHFSDSLE